MGGMASAYMLPEPHTNFEFRGVGSDLVEKELLSVPTVGKSWAETVSNRSDNP